MVRNTTKIIKLFFFRVSGVTLRGRERGWEGNHSSVTLEGVQIFKVTEQERLVEVFWHVLLAKRTWALHIPSGLGIHQDIPQKEDVTGKGIHDSALRHNY